MALIKKENDTETCNPILAENKRKVAEAVEKNAVDERLYIELFQSKREGLDWDIFYQLLEIPSEKESGYWLSAKVASTLLGPVISKQFFKNANARISEKMEDDFLSEVIMEIQRVIPNYDKNKSHFPHYIQLYIQQCGYVHNKDCSVYIQKNKGFRIFSQQNMTNNKGSDDNQKSSADGYENVADVSTIEKEVEEKEIKRQNSIFNNVVIKKFYSKENQETRENIDRLKNIRDELKILKQYDKNNVTQETLNLIKEKEKELNKKENRELLENDMQKTIVNACYWKKFLGGISKYEDLFIDSILKDIEEDEKKVDKTQADSKSDENNEVERDEV